MVRRTQCLQVLGVALKNWVAVRANDVIDLDVIGRNIAEN